MPGRPLALLLCLSALAPSHAGGQVSVSIYPVEAEGLTEGDRADVQSLVESAVRTGERRGVIRLRTPAILPASCRAPASDACLALLAKQKDCVILTPRAKQRTSQIAVTLSFVEPTGRRTRPAAFAFDSFLQDLRPAVQAVAMAESDLQLEVKPDVEPKERAEGAERREPLAAQAAPAAAPELASAGPRVALKPAEPSAASRALDPPAPKRGSKAGEWKGTVGPWASLGGVVLLAGGATAGLLGKSLNDDLTKKAGSNSLVPGDAASFDRLDTYALLANSLLIVGGVVTATGLTIWAMAPDDGPTRRPPGFGVMGRF
jgi:hypothetical protein